MRIRLVIAGEHAGIDALFAWTNRPVIVELQQRRGTLLAADGADFEAEASASAAHFSKAVVRILYDGALTREHAMPHLSSTLGDGGALVGGRLLRCLASRQLETEACPFE